MRSTDMRLASRQRKWYSNKKSDVMGTHALRGSFENMNLPDADQSIEVGVGWPFRSGNDIMG